MKMNYSMKMIKLIKEIRKHKGKGKRIRVGFYPYTYVRTSVMKSLLLRKQDYDKLLKMDLNEIAEFLQETSYKNEIDHFAQNLKGTEMLEAAINANLASTFKKLKRISSEELGLIVDEYLKRNDIENIKTVLRGNFTGAPTQKVLSSLIGAGTLSMEFYEGLISKQSVKEIIESLAASGFKHLASAHKSFAEKNDLGEIENALDNHYYKSLLDFSRRLSNQGALFKDFLSAELRVLNILTILRLKRAGKKSEDIGRYIFYFGDKKYDKHLKGIMESGDIEGVASALEKTEFREAVKGRTDLLKGDGSLINLEVSLKKFLLGKTTLLAHKNMLSVDTILSYMFAKDIESRNLRILIKGKQLGISDDFIESQLII